MDKLNDQTKHKRIPLHKDPVYIEKVKKEFIEAHNKRIREKNSKPKT